MHESTVWRETWTYECLSCLHDWHEDYEVGHCADGNGGDVVYYRRSGHACTSPWTELRCPSCGGYDVKVLPPGRARGGAVAAARRHPELDKLFRIRRQNG